MTFTGFEKIYAVSAVTLVVGLAFTSISVSADANIGIAAILLWIALRLSRGFNDAFHDPRRHTALAVLVCAVTYWVLLLVVLSVRNFDATGLDALIVVGLPVSGIAFTWALLRTVSDPDAQSAPTSGETWVPDSELPSRAGGGIMGGIADAFVKAAEDSGLSRRSDDDT